MGLVKKKSTRLGRTVYFSKCSANAEQKRTPHTARPIGVNSDDSAKVVWRFAEVAFSACSCVNPELYTYRCTAALGLYTFCSTSVRDICTVEKGSASHWSAWIKRACRYLEQTSFWCHCTRVRNCSGKHIIATRIQCDTEFLFRKLQCLDVQTRGITSAILTCVCPIFFFAGRIGIARRE